MATTFRRFGAALEWCIDQFGGLVNEVENPITVASSGVTLLASGNGDRMAIVIINLGAVDVFIAPNSQVSTSFGIRLAASGGGIAMSVRDDFTLPSRNWYATPASASTSTVYVLEQNRNTGVDMPQ